MNVGCRPRGVLSQRELVGVLCDLHYADAVLQVGGMNYGHEETLCKAYSIVLDRHGVTQAQFDSTMVWYTNHPHRLNAVYPKVVSRLEAERDEWLAANESQGRFAHKKKRELRDIAEVESGWWRLPKAKYLSSEDALGGVDSLRFYGVRIEMQDSVCVKMQEKCE